VRTNYDHLDNIPNKEELIIKLKEFNEIDVDEFKDPEIDEIAKTLKDGDL
jgi:hypothetical protein